MKKILKNDFFKGAIFLTTSSFIVNILNYFFYLIIARSLGPSGYGELAAFFSYLSILSLPFSMVSTYVTQKISGTKHNKFEYARNIEILLKNKIKRWWIPIVIGSIVIIPFTPTLTNLSLFPSLSLIPFIVFGFITSIYDSIIAGIPLFFLSSLLGILSIVFKLLGAVFTLTTSAGISIVLFFIFLSSLLRAVVINRKIKSALSPTFHLSNKLIFNTRIITVLRSRQFIFTIFSLVGITLFSNIDIVFAKKIFTSQNAGLYSSWSLFAKIILYAIGPLLAVSFIFFTSRDNVKYHRKSFLLSLPVLLLIGIASYIFYSRFAGFIIYILVGYKFNSIAPFLGYASIFGTLFTAITFFNNYFLAKNSRILFVLPLSMPIYLLLILLFAKNILSLIHINIFFSSFLVLLYIVGFFIGDKNKNALYYNK